VKLLLQPDNHWKQAVSEVPGRNVSEGLHRRRRLVEPRMYLIVRDWFCCYTEATDISSFLLRCCCRCCCCCCLLALWKSTLSRIGKYRAVCAVGGVAVAVASAATHDAENGHDC